MEKESKHEKYFTRMIKIVQRLSLDGSVHVNDLADELSVTKRTIYRDLDRLSFFPIYLEDGIISVIDGFSLENANLNDGELLISELAFSAIDSINEDIDKTIETVRSKVSAPLFFTPYDIKPESYENINMNSELLNKIEDAIKKRNVSKITCSEVSSKVEPYKVVAFDGFWYLLAKDLEDGKIKTYLVSKISIFRATLEVYATKRDNIDAILQNVHTAWFKDGHSFEVQIRVKKPIAHYFQLKKHLSSQKILKENGDGSLLVGFSVSSDEDVDNLIKSWLPHIEVIKPERFRKKIISELEDYVKELKSYSYGV